MSKRKEQKEKEKTWDEMTPEEREARMLEVITEKADLIHEIKDMLEGELDFLSDICENMQEIETRMMKDQLVGMTLIFAETRDTLVRRATMLNDYLDDLDGRDGTGSKKEEGGETE